VFDGCKGLRTIEYEGSQSDWNIIKKDKSWNQNAHFFNVSYNSYNPSQNRTSTSYSSSNTSASRSTTYNAPSYSSNTSAATDNSYFSFELDGNGYSIKIKDKNRCPSELVIPSSYNGRTVTKIGSSGFCYCNASKVVLPNTITHIEGHAFSFCNKIRSINIPTSVESIGTNPFAAIPISAIYVDPSNAYYKKEGNCIVSKAGRVIAADHTSTIPAGIKQIGNFAFRADENLRTVEIPSGVELICGYTFANCSSLTSVSIPRSVKEIDWNVFDNCNSLKAINYEGSSSEWNAITKDDSWNQGAPTFNVSCYAYNPSQNRTSTSYSSSNTSASRSTTHNAPSYSSSSYVPTDASYFTFELLKDNTYKVKIKDKNKCPDDLKIPATYSGRAVTEIAYNGFQYLPAKTITIPEGILRIPDHSFSFCRNLRWISVPASVIDIKDNTFEEVPVEKIIISEGNKKYSKDGNCIVNRSAGTLHSGDKTSTIPGYIKEICSFAFRNQREMGDVYIPDGVQIIGGYSFSGCKSVRTIVIPRSVTKIKWNAFDGCDALTTIKYQGSKSDWKRIDKHKDWKQNSGKFTVDCTDGSLSKLFS